MISPIKLQSVCKSYRIYSNPQDRFKQALLDRLRTSLRATNHDSHNPYYREYWALKDISFELRPGEAMGILGRNGAGKSTLLQIIAGTLRPSSGIVETQGRITALLELGSGFNPEFTGRENVFMNASILGLTRDEAESRYDEIVAFADIGDFIDQPVKTYSSGMMMRLAFSVQTAVQPSVLIVDEALGVGDMFFQAKCMIRLRELLDSGVSLLFVSHDVGTVRQICHRAMLLNEGRMIGLGKAALIADQYVRHQLEERNGLSQTSMSAIDDTIFSEAPEDCILDDVPLKPEDCLSLKTQDESDVVSDKFIDCDSAPFEMRARFNRMGNRDAEITNVQMVRNGIPTTYYDYDDEVRIFISVRFNRLLRNLNLAIKVRTLQGIDVLFQDTRIQDEMTRSYSEGSVYIFEWCMKLPLMHGSYALTCALAHPPENVGEDWVFVDVIPVAYEFSVSPRKEGMIGGFVTVPAELVISLQDRQSHSDACIQRET